MKNLKMERKTTRIDKGMGRRDAVVTARIHEMQATLDELRC